MAKMLGKIGPHAEVEDLGRADVNGRPMFMCNVCHTFTRDFTHFAGFSVPCIPEGGCKNCDALSHSHAGAPAVPLGGNCNTILHECPNDGRRWWQFNDYFHLWQQVTNPREWLVLLQERLEGSSATKSGPYDGI